jgi:hypothetical protein
LASEASSAAARLRLLRNSTSAEARTTSARGRLALLLEQPVRRELLRAGQGLLRHPHQPPRQQQPVVRRRSPRGAGRGGAWRKDSSAPSASAWARATDERSRPERSTSPFRLTSAVYSLTPFRATKRPAPGASRHGLFRT